MLHRRDQWVFNCRHYLKRFIRSLSQQSAHLHYRDITARHSTICRRRSSGPDGMHNLTWEQAQRQFHGRKPDTCVVHSFLFASVRPKMPETYRTTPHYSCTQAMTRLLPGKGRSSWLLLLPYQIHQLQSSMTLLRPSSWYRHTSGHQQVRVYFKLRVKTCPLPFLFISFCGSKMVAVSAGVPSSRIY